MVKEQYSNSILFPFNAPWVSIQWGPPLISALSLILAERAEEKSSCCVTNCAFIDIGSCLHFTLSSWQFPTQQFVFFGIRGDRPSWSNFSYLHKMVMSLCGNVWDRTAAGYTYLVCCLLLSAFQLWFGMSRGLPRLLFNVPPTQIGCNYKLKKV